VAAGQPPTENFVNRVAGDPARFLPSEVTPVKKLLLAAAIGLATDITTAHAVELQARNPLADSLMETLFKCGYEWADGAKVIRNSGWPDSDKVIAHAVNLCWQKFGQFTYHYLRPEDAYAAIHQGAVTAIDKYLPQNALQPPPVATSPTASSPTLVPGGSLSKSR
jgi:hypothetical protein